MQAMEQPISRERLEQLVELAELLNQEIDFLEMVRIAIQRIAALLQADTGIIHMLNPRTRQTIRTLMRESKGGQSRKIQLLRNLISGWIVNHNSPFLSADIRSDERFKAVNDSALPVRAVVGVPVRVKQRIIGIILLMNAPEAGEFTAADVRDLKKIAAITAPHLYKLKDLQQFFDSALPETALLQKYRQIGLIGKCPLFVGLLKSIEAAAKCDVRVVLQGKSGSGKELVARAIHTFSERSNGPYIAIDCGAIPHHLVESELFGHVKGAFTGAISDRKGLFEAANGGTLFLDEITNLPVDMQAKLMRVLQENEIKPLGSNRRIRIDVRIISASSSPLNELIREKKFREDLFYRLYVFPIQIPSLDERREDIPILIDYFLQKFAKRHKKQPGGMDQKLLRSFQQHHWQGNIRELANVIERITTLLPADTEVIHADHLPPDLRTLMRRSVEHANDANRRALPEQVADLEKRLIHQALASCGGNQSQAARALKIPVQTLRNKMKKYEIEMPRTDDETTPSS